MQSLWQAVQAKTSENAAYLQHGQMDAGAESPITNEQVVLLEQRVELPDLRLFMSEQREDDHLNDNARLSSANFDASDKWADHFAVAHDGKQRHRAVDYSLLEIF